MCEGGIKGGGNCGTALAQIRRRSSPSLSALSHAAPPSCENQADLPWNEEVSAPLFWGHWVKPGRSHWCCRRARFCKFSLTSAQLASSAKPWTTPAVICWAGSTRASSYVFSGGTSGKVSHSCPTSFDGVVLHRVIPSLLCHFHDRIPLASVGGRRV